MYTIGANIQIFSREPGDSTSAAAVDDSIW